MPKMKRPTMKIKKDLTIGAVKVSDEGKVKQIKVTNSGQNS